jgi:hypothetical protein
MIDDYLKQGVTYQEFHSRNAYGDPSYNAAVTLPARVSYRQKKVYTKTGDETTSFCHVSVIRAISYDDLITLEDGVSRVPLSIRHARNADGTLHHAGVDL